MLNTFATSLLIGIAIIGLILLVLLILIAFVFVIDCIFKLGLDVFVEKAAEYLLYAVLLLLFIFVAILVIMLIRALICHYIVLA